MDALGKNPCEYEARAVQGAALTKLLDAIRKTRGNGKILIGRFCAVGAIDPEQWFRGRTLAELDTNIRDLLTSNAMETTMPELKVPNPYPLSAPPRFSDGGSGSTLTLDGELALTLVRGGAYSEFSGTAAEAKQLAVEAVRDLVGDRHEDFTVLGSERAWSPFFCDLAWDATWLIVDRRRFEVTVIAMTDAD